MENVMNAKSTSDRWAICKAMSAITGIKSNSIFQCFAKIDETIANAALTQPDDTQDPTAANALRDHINSLSAGEVPTAEPPQPLPDATAESGPNRAVAEYVQRLRLALWFIVQCGGVEQAQFILGEAAKAFPADTSPAFNHLKK